MLVEDNTAFVQVALAGLLGDHDVCVAPSLADARASPWASFEAVLLDYDLPDGKGDALVPELLAHGLRVIAISSHARGNAALRAAGAHATCGKLAFDRIGEVLASVGSPSRA